MRLTFCCREMKLAVVKGEITITDKGIMEIITVNIANHGVGIELNYCPFCGEKIE